MLQLHFDGGTIVVRGPGSAPELPFSRWDARIQALRAPAYSYRRMRDVLNHAQISCSDNVLKRATHSGAWTAPDLRPYQHAALLSWLAAGGMGSAVMPTGSGKTRLACAAMAARGVSCLCLVPTRILLHQWREEIARHHHGPVGCIGDGVFRIEQVTVVTFESAYRHMARIGNRFELLVVDEVHHFGAGARDEALEMSAAPLRLGLTATAPPATQLTRLADLIGPVVCELSIGELAGQWLADFDAMVLLLRLNPRERASYDQAVSEFRSVFVPFRRLCPNATWADFVRSAAGSEPGQRALAAYRRSREITSYAQAKRAALSELLDRHRGARVLVFTSDNASAYAVARDHLIMPITCDIDRAERDAALAAFRSGELRTLVSARVLNEGIDVPDAEVAIIVGGSSSEREHVQRIGRLLRPTPGKRASVYELVAADTHEVHKSRQRQRGIRGGARSHGSAT